MFRNWMDGYEQLCQWTTREPRDSEAHCRALFEQAAVGVCHIAPDGRILEVNDRYCTMAGHGRAELLNLKIQQTIHPEDIGTDLPDPIRRLAEGPAGQGMEVRLVRKEGASIWVRLTLTKVPAAAGEPDNFLGLAEDIQQRKELEAALQAEQASRQEALERQLAEQTGALQAANQQLEAILYATSHDLKGPLSRISSFSSLLERGYRDRLDEDGMAMLDFIQGNAVRLTNLVDDLLAHARINQQAACLEPVDLLASVKGAIREKFYGLREINSIFRLELPSVLVMADPYGLNQVLQNILENALKYSAHVADPVIEIGGMEENGCFRLWVKDNGIGFDMKYHDRIFELFRRLHTYTEYAGTGVGLALVKRAMDRMEGKVWATSEPGRGATFYLEFRLAKK